MKIIFVTIAYFFLICFSAWSFEFADVMLKSSDIKQYPVLGDLNKWYEDGCKIEKSPKPYLISMQTSILYEKPEMYKDLIGDFKVAHVNLKCDSGDSSVMYLRFQDKSAATNGHAVLKGVVWGEKGPNRHHPERIRQFSNMIAIFSSKKPGPPDYFQFGKMTNAEPPRDELAEYRKLFACEADTAITEACDVLSQIESYKAAPWPSKANGAYFGQAWYWAPDKKIANEFMYTSITKDSFAPRSITPDNESEATELREVLAGKRKPGKELSSYLASINPEVASIEKVGKSYRATIKGNTYCLFPIKNRIYLIVSAGHISMEPGPVLLGYIELK